MFSPQWKKRVPPSNLSVPWTPMQNTETESAIPGPWAHRIDLCRPGLHSESFKKSFLDMVHASLEDKVSNLRARIRILLAISCSLVLTNGLIFFRSHAILIIRVNLAVPFRNAADREHPLVLVAFAIVLAIVLCSIILNTKCSVRERAVPLFKSDSIAIVSGGCTSLIRSFP